MQEVAELLAEITVIIEQSRQKAKGCGKTESAKQFAKTIVQVDTDDAVPEIMATNPKRLLMGQTPVLLDEWQVQPKLWNLVRQAVDERALPAQFILTGSANPEETVKMHL